ncbi:carbon-nitrogen hydrolase family protein [Maritimibacter sp. HL-12]|uniref:carbon-nitrogen hydrolase family protein n=1 Tax=Maritimibacter sp. HL-12 TaxID=1162418 RepID=UPI000A0F1FDF|nr:carbon-nitrogen hydrolase family protein [Maritimibacter sp. HL-12]SMH39309.1 Predicted amidohydrolase [Maritimibacter sp. HL-12]
MKLAAACYPIDWMEGFDCYADKLASWVSDAAGQGADLLVFPEYGAMELAAFAGRAVAADTQGSMRAVSVALPRAWDLHAELAARHNVHILAASGPYFASDHAVNRAMFFTPDGKRQPHDKQIMTRWERDPMDVRPGDPLVVMETALGRIGVLICYDAEFPLLARALVEAGAEIILVPSATEALEGFSRVRVGAMARALEGQCVVVHAPTLGAAPWNPVVDENTGAASIYGPPDRGFPATGILAEGAMNAPGWTIAEVDLARVRAARADGNVLTMAHWSEQPPRLQSVRCVTLA